MTIIEKIVQEFDDAYSEFEEAKNSNDFHEASDIKAYMFGLVKAMTIILDYNKYTIDVRKMVDICISRLNKIDNVN